MRQHRAALDKNQDFKNAMKLCMAITSSPCLLAQAANHLPCHSLYYLTAELETYDS